MEECVSSQYTDRIRESIAIISECLRRMPQTRNDQQGLNEYMAAQHEACLQMDRLMEAIAEIVAEHDKAVEHLLPWSVRRCCED